MRAFLENRGIEILNELSFGETDDRKVARIAERSSLEAILQAGKTPGAQAVFASCTNLRTFGIIDAAEKHLNLPVVSSNSALLWHLGRLAGLTDLSGPGMLYRSGG
jgi:maleate isomerase